MRRKQDPVAKGRRVRFRAYSASRLDDMAPELGLERIDVLDGARSKRLAEPLEHGRREVEAVQGAALEAVMLAFARPAVTQPSAANSSGSSPPRWYAVTMLTCWVRGVEPGRRARRRPRWSDWGTPKRSSAPWPRWACSRPAGAVPSCRRRRPAKPRPRALHLNRTELVVGRGTVTRGASEASERS